MGAQSYYQSWRATVAPRPLRWLGVAVVALLVLVAALPVLMSLDRDAVAAAVRRDDPTLSAAAADVGVVAVLVYTWVLHAVYGALAVWFTVKALRGRPWARVALTVLMIVATLNSVDSAAAGAEYYWAVIPSDLLHLIVIGLLWLPATSRAYFAAHRRGRSASGEAQPVQGAQ